MKIIYICDKCDTQFSNFEACMACERGHVMPVAYTGVEATGYDGFRYPQRVILEMTDGAKVRYKSDCVIAEPEATKQEEEEADTGAEPELASA